MSSETPTSKEDSAEKPTKTQINKEKRRAKHQKNEEFLQAKKAAEEAKAAVSSVIFEADPLAANYGDIPLEDLQSKEIPWKIRTKVCELCDEKKGQKVLIRGYAQTIRTEGKEMAFVVVREIGFTVQCVLTVAPDLVSPQMVEFVSNLSLESIVEISGVVSVPSQPITGATQQVEIQATKVHCVNRAARCFKVVDKAKREVEIPCFKVLDISKSEQEIKEALKRGDEIGCINQDTRLNYRVLDLRTPANQGIFRIQCQIEDLFRLFLLSEDFVGIHTPRVTKGSIKRQRADVLTLEKQKNKRACLGVSPSLHKQMAVCGGFSRVFEIGPVFKVDEDFTDVHLCEFIGLDVEMEIKEHYSEVMDIVDRLFVHVFDRLNQNCSKELEAIKKQYPFETLKYLPKTLKLTYEEAVHMLMEAGVKITPLDAITASMARKLGQLVLKKYATEFFIVHRYPSAVRPFYTMQCEDDIQFSNSFAAFLRGVEILSGAQHLFVPELLTELELLSEIDIKSISTYFDSLRYGAVPYGGFEAGLERVTMLLCGLDNIRKTSLFPRDRMRLTP